MVDPSVDLVHVDWSPLRKSTFILPLLNDLEDWRLKLMTIAEETKMNDTSWFLENPDITFIADFPGMMLENYIDEDLGKTNITLLAGEVNLLKPNSKKNTTLITNHPVHIEQGTHKVFVTSDTPACYMYIYSNTTKSRLDRQLLVLERQISSGELNLETLNVKAKRNETLKRLLVMREEKQLADEKLKRQQPKSVVEQLYASYEDMKRGFRMIYFAYQSILTGKPILDMIEKDIEQRQKDISPTV